MSISRRVWQIASLLFGLALLALILSRVDREALWAHFSQARPGPLLVAAAGIAFLHVLKAIRWKLMLDAQGIPLCRVCDSCRKSKLSRYRPEILSGYTQADVDEPIEPDEGVG